MLPLDRQNTYRARYKQMRPGWQPSTEALEAIVRRSLSPQTRALDVGCGRGGVMELFWREVGLAAGVDPDLASLAGRRAPMPAACARAEALPFGDGAFDLVLCVWVLEHLAQPKQALAEARRVLAPGGRFIFLTPNARHPLIVFNRFSWAFPAVQRLLVPRLYGRSESDTFRVRYRANTVGRLRALAAAHGFRVVSLEAISDPSYLAFSGLAFRLSVWLERLLPREWGVHLLGEFERV